MNLMQHEQRNLQFDIVLVSHVEVNLLAPSNYILLTFSVTTNLHNIYLSRFMQQM